MVNVDEHHVLNQPHERGVRQKIGGVPRAACFRRKLRNQRWTLKRTSPCLAIMGRVRTKTVKKASRVIIEKYYGRLTLDFAINQRVCEEVAIIQSKRLRNKIAGFTTHLMKRIQRGPVRGISLKLQEEERERRMDFVPEESAVNTEVIEVDTETHEMLKAINLATLPGVKIQAPTTNAGGPGALCGIHVWVPRRGTALLLAGALVFARVLMLGRLAFEQLVEKA
eukprot:jgi/Botrbrau1/12196/Bobra.0186s0101.1